MSNSLKTLFKLKNLNFFFNYKLFFFYNFFYWNLNNSFNNICNLNFKLNFYLINIIEKNYLIKNIFFILSLNILKLNYYLTMQFLLLNKMNFFK